jgi:hypothetical protein
MERATQGKNIKQGSKKATVEGRFDMKALMKPQ